VEILKMINFMDKVSLLLIKIRVYMRENSNLIKKKALENKKVIKLLILVSLIMIILKEKVS
jgi:hypothetical protein